MRLSPAWRRDVHVCSFGRYRGMNGRRAERRSRQHVTHFVIFNEQFVAAYSSAKYVTVQPAMLTAGDCSLPYVQTTRKCQANVLAPFKRWRT
jgi:hypothetical protein